MGFRFHGDGEEHMLPAATIGGATGVLVFILSTIALWNVGDAMLVAAIFGSAIGSGVFLTVYMNPEETDWFAELLSRKLPFLEKQVELFRKMNHQNVEAAQTKRRAALIRNMETFKANQIEYLGEFDPMATPDNPEEFTLDELEVLRNGPPYQAAIKAVVAEKRLRALENRCTEINELFGDETNVLMFTSEEYMNRNPKLRKMLRSQIHHQVNGGGDGSLGSGAEAALNIVGNSIGAYQRAAAQEGMRHSIECLRFGRAIHDLKSNERALLRAYYLLEAHGVVSIDALEQMQNSIVFADGNCVIGHTLKNPDKFDQHGMKLAENAIRGGIVGHDEAMQLATNKVRSLKDHENETIAELVRSTFEHGNSWATAKDVQNSQTYKPYEEGTADLLLGWYEDEIPVGFGGYESLITIARPGTGKTQSQVIPNLLTYPGSVIALDVKGELYETTAATRAEKFGKIIKLDLRDITASKTYNPLVHVNKEKAWTSARPVADLLFAAGNKKNKSGGDRYWEGRARDMVQAFIAYQLITSDHPTLTTILDMLSPSTEEFEDYIKAMANAGNRGLDRYANTLADMPEKQLGGIFDHARSTLSIFEDEDIEVLTNENSWNPSDLLLPGTSLYLCVPEGGIASYAPLLRLIIGQHLDMFDAPELGRPELPLTCFLDELPQLGFCEPIDKATELGRGRGVRLWMFAQDHEQITGTYGQGIIDRCAIEMYMKPADSTAEHLSRILGETEDFFTGEKKPLAPVHDLLGEKFSERIVVKTSGGKPISLTKRMAYQKD
tara:strand:+ start:180 stop:2522 length:2343 start_codon:yes stop_codon:yes gene_type:complete